MASRPGPEIGVRSPAEYLAFNRASFDQVFGDVETAQVRESLWRLLSDPSLAAVSMVRESPYVDKDILACFNVQASRSFTPVEKNASRVHFFDVPVTEHILESRTAASSLDLEDHYLGFTVIRPDGPSTFGRTLLKVPPHLEGREIRCEVQSQYRASLIGRWLEVTACPYLSQDRKALACATAALYMSTNPLPKKDEDTRSATTAEITQLANGLARGYGPTIGAAGLTNEQMERALLELGYDPFVLDYPPPHELMKLASAYTDGGFAPVVSLYLPQIERATEGEPGKIEVLAAAYHVVTVVGHSAASGFWQLAPGAASEIEEVPARELDILVVHDDQQGLYLAANVLSTGFPPEGPAAPLNRGSCAELRFLHAERSGSVTSVLVPVPASIMTSLEDVKGGVDNWLRHARQRGALVEETLYLRPLLIRSRDFKDGLDDRQGMPSELKTHFRRLPLPLYVWLVELSLDLPKDGSEPRVAGELVLDSTSPGVPAGEPLIWHLPGSIGGLYVSGNDSHSFVAAITEEGPYAPYEPPRRARALGPMATT